MRLNIKLDQKYKEYGKLELTADNYYYDGRQMNAHRELHKQELPNITNRDENRWVLLESNEGINGGCGRLYTSGKIITGGREYRT